LGTHYFRFHFTLPNSLNKALSRLLRSLALGDNGDLSPTPGYSPSYYVGILQYNSTKGLGYFLTTQYTNNPNPNGYYDYYYSGSGWGYSLNPFHFGPYLNYYFLEDNTGNTKGYSGSDYFVFMPPDQQNNQNYYQYGVFWLYNWFQAENNNMNIFFLMNGNIYNYSLALETYNFNGYSANAIPPASPASIPTLPASVLCVITGECKPIFVQSYINAYNTAFNQKTSSFSGNYQVALNRYWPFTFGDINNNFVPGTFGYREEYENLDNNPQRLIINFLQDNLNVYYGQPYLFVSAGSGGGSGFMYLDWIIVTYGVPYVINVS